MDVLGGAFWYNIWIGVSGKNTLTPGTACRLYLGGADDQAAQVSLPEPLIPARTLLGYEFLN